MHWAPDVFVHTAVSHPRVHTPLPSIKKYRKFDRTLQYGSLVHGTPGAPQHSHFEGGLCHFYRHNMSFLYLYPSLFDLHLFQQWKATSVWSLALSPLCRHRSGPTLESWLEKLYLYPRKRRDQINKCLPRPCPPNPFPKVSFIRVALDLNVRWGAAGDAGAAQDEQLEEIMKKHPERHNITKYWDSNSESWYTTQTSRIQHAENIYRLKLRTCVSAVGDTELFWARAAGLKTVPLLWKQGQNEQLCDRSDFNNPAKPRTSALKLD